MQKLLTTDLDKAYASRRALWSIKSPAANQLTVSRKATGLRSIMKTSLSGFCTGKSESIRVVYGKSRIYYQGYVQATQLFSGACTDKRGFIRFLYGQIRIYQDHVRKRRICYQDHVRVGRTLYHGDRLWNDLLCHDLLWDDCFLSILPRVRRVRLFHTTSFLVVHGELSLLPTKSKKRMIFSFYRHKKSACIPFFIVDKTKHLQGSQPCCIKITRR